MEADIYLEPTPICLMDASKISIKDSPEITNHIVVCGLHASIYYFLLPLRAKYL